MLRTILILMVGLLLMGHSLFAKNGYTAKTDTNTINQLLTDYFKLRNSQPTKALESLQNGILIARQIKSVDKMALLLYHKGYLYRVMGIYNLAMNSNISALELYEKIGNVNEKSWLLIDIGWVYLENQKNYSVALNHFFKAKGNFEMLHNNIGLIVANHDIGHTYCEMGKYDKALECFNEAAKLSVKLGEKRHEADSYSLIGKTYLLMNDLAKAEVFINKAYKNYARQESPDLMANIYGVYADLVLKKGLKEKALTYCDSALMNFTSVGGKVGISETYLQKASIYASQNSWNSAIEYAKMALEVADSNELMGQKLTILPILSEYLSRVDQSAQSYALLKRYYDLKESNSVRYAQQLESEYAFQNELKEKELQDEIDLKKRLIIWFLSSGLLLFSTLLALIFFKNLQLKESYHHLFKRTSALHKKEQELAEINKQAKYNRSTLKNEQHQTLLNELLELMESKKVFLQNDLSLDDLAKQLNTNRTYISQIINDNFNTNFSNFVNDYRVKEAKEIFLHSSHKYLTIEAIAQKVGFNSKSSFNTAFKKFTGLTPSNFMELHALENQTKSN